MNEDIEFLRDFLDCDRYRIAELIDSVPFALQKLGHFLRQHDKGPFTVVYRNEDDPMYELIQLLDGNNFEVKYGVTSIMGLKAVQMTPLYTETIEVEYVQEQSTTTNFDTYSEYNCEWTSDPPEIRNPPRRGLRAK